jgi:hypothetical protein
MVTIKIYICFAVFLILSVTTSAQNKTVPFVQLDCLSEFTNYNSVKNSELIDTVQEVKSRTSYFTMNISYPKVLSLGFGYQCSDEWSYVAQVSIVNSEQEAFPGIGLSISRFISNAFPFNNISVHPTILIFQKGEHSYLAGLYGFSCEIGFGNESIDKSGLHFLWSVGGIIILVKKDKPLYYPCIRLGFNWNF